MLLGDMVNLVFSFVVIFVGALFVMQVETELSPCKLFICHLIHMAWDDFGEHRSEILQEFYSQFSMDEKASIAKKEKEFIMEIQKAWEPDKNACCSFFSSLTFFNTFLQQCISEWEESIVDTDSLNKWMAKIIIWSKTINKTQLSEIESDVFDFLSSRCFTFMSLPFSSSFLITERLLQWFQSNIQDIVQFQEPLPPFYPTFTNQQEQQWIENVQSILYTKNQEIDLDSRSMFIC